MAKAKPPVVPKGMQVSEVRVRPVSNGHVVSHYQRNLTNPHAPGNTVEYYHPDAKGAAAHMAALSQAQKETQEKMAHDQQGDSGQNTAMPSGY